MHVTFTNKLLASAVSVLMWVPHYLNTSVLRNKKWKTDVIQPQSIAVIIKEFFKSF